MTFKFIPRKNRRVHRCIVRPLIGKWEQNSITLIYGTDVP